MDDTIDLGEVKPWGVIPALDEFHPGGFECLTMSAPRAEEFDEPILRWGNVSAFALYYDETIAP